MMKSLGFLLVFSLLSHSPSLEAARKRDGLHDEQEAAFVIFSAGTVLSALLMLPLVEQALHAFSSLKGAIGQNLSYMHPQLSQALDPLNALWSQGIAYMEMGFAQLSAYPVEMAVLISVAIYGYHNQRTAPAVIAFSLGTMRIQYDRMEFKLRQFFALLAGKSPTDHPGNEELQSVASQDDESFSPLAKEGRKLIENTGFLVDKKLEDASKLWVKDREALALSKLAIAVFDLRKFYSQGLDCNQNVAMHARGLFLNIPWKGQDEESKKHEQSAFILRIVGEIERLKMRALDPKDRNDYKKLLEFWLTDQGCP